MILNFDETPDAGLAVRVLREYQKRCDVRYAVKTGDYSGRERLECNTKNQHQEQRAVLIRDAILTLEAVG